MMHIASKLRLSLLVIGLVLMAAVGYLWSSRSSSRYFNLEWDEQVLLHDGRMMVVHVNRTFERRAKFSRWPAIYRHTEISFDAGGTWQRFKRNFEDHSVTMIEEKTGNWYVGLQPTTGVSAHQYVDPRYPVLILGRDGTERPATSWADVPDFPRQNIMPVTPSPEGLSAFAGSLLTWQTKMNHWKNHPRAAGDDGIIIQRHANPSEPK